LKGQSRAPDVLRRCVARSRCVAGAGRCDMLFLLFHGSFLLSSPGWFGNPKCALHTWSRATGGLPLALRLGLGWSGNFLRGHRIAPRARRASRCAG
jgi:hypothetical protein